MKKIKLITTTSTIDGWEIEKYLGVVTYQVVIGTNLFKDVFASWRDVFGGSVKSYQRELEKLEIIAIDELKRKAIEKGGNIILGLRLDFDEISGGGKSMFMLSASGTSVLAHSNRNNDQDKSDDKVSYEQLIYEKNRNIILSDINEKKYMFNSIENIKTLIKYRIDSCNDVIKYLDNDSDNNYEKNKIVYIEYFANLSKKTINTYLKSAEFQLIKERTFHIILEILEETYWFDSDVLNELLEHENTSLHQRAVYLAELPKTDYNNDDILNLKNISAKIKNAFEKYPIMVESKSFLGKDKQKWICPNCNAHNSIVYNLCSKDSCTSNIYGFTFSNLDPLEISEDLSLEAKTLESILTPS